ncbi:hypothetical protein A3D88_01955 [Candidatus Peribacteria bacterium RIFCSPHIGHO2_02_FULL_52_16]|nr:MAG: hypothetical protein A2706_05150 [Candidatus Peribacteria bacterium RIFCSPHIGHO2_01_FULL_51_35]OGJ61150.1 MAG: hypothetical protein A3D88_01955 [Candidatus Peribacteria bacterium RIFCSPHIGHO2_02_FULL_52_16]
MRIALLLLFTSFFASAEPALAAFIDVSADHPQAEAITWMETQGIVKGYADGSYKPNRFINRAEFTKIVIGSVLGYSPEADPSGFDVFSTAGLEFSDIESGAWYIPYLRHAFELAIIGGYPDETFHPEQNINIAEAAKIIVRANGFIIGDEAPDWYRPYVDVLAERGAIPASVRSFDQFLMRGEMAEIIYRLRVGATSSSSGNAVSSDSSSSMIVQGKYLPYEKGVIGNGRKSLLFFYAPWCPYCRANDARLSAWYDETEDIVINTYKVNYDAEKALRQRFGVATQDTHILLSGTGQVIEMTSFPSESMLRDLLER